MRGPDLRASVGLLYTVAIVDSDHCLGERLLVEDGLDPEQLLPYFEAFGQVEGSHYRDGFFCPVEVDGVLRRLHQDLSVLVGDNDAGPALLVRGVFAALKLGVDDEGCPAGAVGADLIQYPKERQPIFVLRAALGEDECRALDHTFALAMHLAPPRSRRLREAPRKRCLSDSPRRLHPASARPWRRRRRWSERR